MSKLLDFTKPLQTRDGCEVRIYATDGEGEFPIHGAVKLDQGWAVFNWGIEGKWNRPCGECDWDLVQAPEPKKKLVGWVNIYKADSLDVFGSIYPTKESALSASGSRLGINSEVIARVKVEIEYTEGQFDDE